MNSYDMTTSVLTAFAAAASAAGCPVPHAGLVHEPSFKAWLAGRDLRTVRPRQGLAQRQNLASYTTSTDRNWCAYGRIYLQRCDVCGTETPHMTVVGAVWSFARTPLDVTGHECQRCHRDLATEAAQAVADECVREEYARQREDEDRGRAEYDRFEAECRAV